MRPVPFLSPARTDHPAEMRLALRLCLAGLRPPETLCYQGGDFAAWTRHRFLRVIGPHAAAALAMARRGDAAGLARADLALDLPAASCDAGRKILLRREGARRLPVTRRFSAMAAGSAAAGHFATVLALQATDFSIGLLPLLQCLLFCEWHAGQPATAIRDFAAFSLQAAPQLRQLPALLSLHEPSTVSTARRRH